LLVRYGYQPWISIICVGHFSSRAKARIRILALNKMKSAKKKKILKFMCIVKKQFILVISIGPIPQC